MKRLIVVALALLLTACAQITVQKPMTPEPGFAGPHLEADRFVSFDGGRLGLSTWTPSGEPWAVIVGVHGMDDYARAFHLAGPYWADHGIATYAYDQRGFGRSPQRGVWAGDALMTEDLRTLVALVRARYPHAIVAVAGESLGGAVAIEAFASDRPPAADRLVLLAPAVWGWSNQPLSYRLLLELAAHGAPTKVFNPPSFVTEHITTSDNIEELIAMGHDPLMSWGARSDALYGLVNTMEHAWQEVGEVKGPTLYLMGAHDQIIPHKPAVAAALKLPTSDRTAYYAEGYHLLLRDKQAHKVWADIAAFVRDPATPLPSGAPPISATSSVAAAASPKGPPGASGLVSGGDAR